MAYLAIFLGVTALAVGVSGKLPAWKRPALYDPPRIYHRVVYIWLGLVVSGFGIFLLREAHRN